MESLRPERPAKPKKKTQRIVFDFCFACILVGPRSVYVFRTYTIDPFHCVAMTLFIEIKIICCPPSWCTSYYRTVWEGGLSPRAECPPGHSALVQQAGC